MLTSTVEKVGQQVYEILTIGLCEWSYPGDKTSNLFTQG